MRKLVNILIIAIIGGIFCNCEENKMVEYDAGELINFMGYADFGTPTDDENYLEWDRNFGINPKGDSLWVDTVKIGVKISGEIVNYPRRIAFKVKNLSTENMEVILLDEYILPADTGIADLQIIVKRPVKRNVSYEALLLFDYEKSDFGPGAMERQSFSLKCSDQVNLDLWGAETWDSYANKLGKWSETKARFIITTLGFETFSELVSTNKYAIYCSQLVKKLKEYKANPANLPLLDENGDWISFP